MEDPLFVLSLSPSLHEFGCVCDARELAEDSECSVTQLLSNPVGSPVLALDNKRHRGKEKKGPELKMSLTIKSESFSELISSGALGNKA